MVITPRPSQTSQISQQVSFGTLEVPSEVYVYSTSQAPTQKYQEICLCGQIWTFINFFNYFKFLE